MHVAVSSSRSSTTRGAAWFADVAAKRGLRVPAGLSVAFALVAVVAAPLAVFNSGIFHEPDVTTVGSIRGTALVMLVLGLPVLLGGLTMTLTGRRVGEPVWLGALGYLLYNSSAFAIGAAFTRLFPLFLAMFALAFWAVVTLAMRLDPGELARLVKPALPARMLAGYLGFTAFFTIVLWGRQIATAWIDNTVPAGLEKTSMPTNLFHVMDLSVTLPLTVLAAVWLWRRQSWGYLLGGAFLVYGLLESIGVGTDQWFAHIEDASSPTSGIYLFAALSIVGAAAAALFFRHVETRG